MKLQLEDKEWSRLDKLKKKLDQAESKLRRRAHGGGP